MGNAGSGDSDSLLDLFGATVHVNDVRVRPRLLRPIAPAPAGPKRLFTTAEERAVTE